MAKNIQQFNLITLSTCFIALIYIVTITFSPSIHLIPYIMPHDCKRILELILLSFVLLNAIAYITKPEKLFTINKNIQVGFYLTLALAITSSFFAPSPRHALIEISLYTALCYLSLFVAMIYLEHGEKVIKFLTYALLAGMLLYMFSFYVGYVTATAVGKSLSWPRPFYGFTNVRFFQQYQLLGLGLICLPLLNFKLSQNQQRWLIIAIALWWVLLIHGSSRGVLVGWFTAMIATAIIYKSVAWRFLRIQLTTAVLGFVAYLTLFKAVPIMNGQDATQPAGANIFRATTSLRAELWKDALEMIASAPWLGVGPMNYYWQSKLEYGTYPHNSILQHAAEFGLPATLIALAISGYAFITWYKKFNANQLRKQSTHKANIAVILFFTAISSATYSLFSGVNVIALSQILTFTFIGLMIGHYTVDVQKVTNVKKIRFRPIFAIIILTSLIWSTLPELKRGLTSYNRVIGAQERAFSLAPNTIVPRIWMQQNKMIGTHNK